MTDETPIPSPDTSSTIAQDQSDDAAGAITALRVGAVSGASLTAVQVNTILKAMAGVAILSTHAHKLEELVASYGSDMNAISKSLADATDRVSTAMTMPASFNFEASAKAREQLAAQIASANSITDILAAAVRVASAFV